MVSKWDIVAQAAKDAQAFAEEFPGLALVGAEWELAAWRRYSLAMRDFERGWEIYRDALRLEVSLLAHNALRKTS